MIDEFLLVEGVGGLVLSLGNRRTGVLDRGPFGRGMLNPNQSLLSFPVEQTATVGYKTIAAFNTK